MKINIPVAKPALVGNEREYVLDCLDTSWISSNGKYINLFEEIFAKFVGTQYALSCSNGTVALHLALMSLGISPGDEIIVPTLTYVASANSILYCGAKPIFIDSELETWNMNPDLLEGLITEKTRAIIVVHLYGHPVNFDPILNIARKYGLYIIEDAAEAHGALYKEQNVGSIGDIATFSFYGNKIITTGEGGMVCTNNPSLAKKVLQLKGQGQDLHRRYWFPIVGYNYRMTNIQAALGLAQMERIDWHLRRRREIAHEYNRLLSNIDGVTFSPEQAWAKNVYWLSSVVLDGYYDRDQIMSDLLSYGIETRPFFYPMHTLPIFTSFIDNRSFPIADVLSRQGLNLPTYAELTDEEIGYIVTKFRDVLLK